MPGFVRSQVGRRSGSLRSGWSCTGGQGLERVSGRKQAENGDCCGLPAIGRDACRFLSFALGALRLGFCTGFACGDLVGFLTVKFCDRFDEILIPGFLIGVIGRCQRRRHTGRGTGGTGLKRGVFNLGDLVEDILTLADIHLRWLLGQFEMIVTDLQHFPEFEMLAVAVLCHVFGGHAERQRLDHEKLLPALESVTGKAVNLQNLFVGHRVAASRRAGTVNHQVGPGAAIRAVVAVGETHVERQVIARIRIHLVGVNPIVAFRRLTVAFLEFGAELARPFADLIGGNDVVAAVALLLPDLENALFLENPHHDRRPRAHVLRFHLVDELGRQRVFDLVGNGIQRILTAGQAEKQNGQETQRTDRCHGVSWTLQLQVLRPVGSHSMRTRAGHFIAIILPTWFMKHYQTCGCAFMQGLWPVMPGLLTQFPVPECYDFSSQSHRHRKTSGLHGTDGLIGLLAS